MIKMLYLFNEKNIANIVCKNKIQKANKLVFSIVKGLCERELFTYESRVRLTKKHLNIKSKIPIYVNDQVLLMPTNSPKRYDNVWVNYFCVFSYQNHFNKTLVLFDNLDEVVLNVSVNVFKTMMEKASLINQYFANREHNKTI